MLGGGRVADGCAEVLGVGAPYKGSEPAFVSSSPILTGFLLER